MPVFSTKGGPEKWLNASRFAQVLHSYIASLFPHKISETVNGIAGGGVSSCHSRPLLYAKHNTTCLMP